MVNPFVSAPGLDSSFIFPIEVALKIISQRAEDWTLKNVGCNRRECWVLLCVSKSRLSQKQLSDALYVHPNQMVNILDGMEQKGFIRRIKHADNRRQYVIEPTKKGRDAYDKAVAGRAEALRYIFQPLGTDAAEQLRCWALSILGVYKGAAPDLGTNGDI